MVLSIVVAEAFHGVQAYTHVAMKEDKKHACREKHPAQCVYERFAKRGVENV